MGNTHEQQKPMPPMQMKSTTSFSTSANGTSQIRHWWRSWRKRTKLLIQEHVETEDALIEEIRSTVESQESNGEGCMLLIKN